MKNLSKVLMNLAIKMVFGKITPLPWHIEPIVKELIICSFIIGFCTCIGFVTGFILIVEMIN
jgi:hypothetical protein